MVSIVSIVFSTIFSALLSVLLFVFVFNGVAPLVKDFLVFVNVVVVVVVLPGMTPFVLTDDTVDFDVNLFANSFACLSDPSTGFFVAEDNLLDVVTVLVVTVLVPVFNFPGRVLDVVVVVVIVVRVVLAVPPGLVGAVDGRVDDDSREGVVKVFADIGFLVCEVTSVRFIVVVLLVSPLRPGAVLFTSGADETLGFGFAAGTVEVGAFGAVFPATEDDFAAVAVEDNDDFEAGGAVLVFGRTCVLFKLEVRVLETLEVVLAVVDNLDVAVFVGEAEAEAVFAVADDLTGGVGANDFLAVVVLVPVTEGFEAVVFVESLPGTLFCEGLLSSFTSFLLTKSVTAAAAVVAATVAAAAALATTPATTGADSTFLSAAKYFSLSGKDFSLLSLDFSSCDDKSSVATGANDCVCVKLWTSVGGTGETRGSVIGSDSGENDLSTSGDLRVDGIGETGSGTSLVGL